MTDVQGIKDRLDLTQIIGEYVPLKKAGANWRANCPFHHEKTPSFMVQPEKQIWHCFGCGKGGDVFTFIQEMEGMDFPEALRLLSERAGVKIETYRNEIDKSQRNRLLEINKQAAYFFHHFLLEISAAQIARAYLQSRELKSKTIEQWQIGFAPDQWELLTKYLLKKGHGIDDLVASGLTIQRDNADRVSGRGFYDRFRGRVMFPINDVHGNIVGFTGRVLVETENSGGKYVNSPQSVVYDKSRVIYGLDKAKMEIKSKDLAVLVEGQMDTVACHQAGMTNVVAASGTALTIEQVKLLKRYTSNIAIAFDADTAGQNAAKRGIDIALTEGLNIKVINIPEGAGKDADECLKKNPAVWFEAVKNAQDIMEWYLAAALKSLKAGDYRSKQQVTTTLLSQVVKIPHGVERDEWIKRIAEELGVEAGVLREETKKIKLTVSKVDAPVNKTNAAITANSQLENLLQEFWSLILKFPENYEVFATSLEGKYFNGSWLSGLYENAQNLYNTNRKLAIDELRQLFEHTAPENPVDILRLRPYRNLEEMTNLDAKTELIVIWERLKTEWIKQRRQELQRALSQAEKSGDKIKLDGLLREMLALK